MRRNKKGFTFVEFVMVIVLATVLASAFVGLIIPQINLFFFIPQRMKVQNAASDLLNILVEGDHLANGLRYAGPLSPGADSIINARGDRIVYTYIPLGSGEAGGTFTPMTVQLDYDAVNRRVTRHMNGIGPPQPVPYYSGDGSGILVDPGEGTDFFRFYDAGHNQLSAPVAAAQLPNIRLVEVTCRVSSGSGKVTESEGSVVLKSGAMIKQYTA